MELDVRFRPFADIADWCKTRPMVLNRQPSIVTLLFFVVFAAWFVADRYAPVGFYRLNVAGAVELALALLVLSSFAAVISASLIRSWRARAVEWMTLGAAAVLLVSAELAWRFIVAPLPMNGFKVAAIVMDMGTPIVALLGLIAAIAEWRDHTRREQGESTVAA
jgi:hypothetical protein